MKVKNSGFLLVNFVLNDLEEPINFFVCVVQLGAQLFDLGFNFVNSGDNLVLIIENGLFQCFILTFDVALKALNDSSPLIVKLFLTSIFRRNDQGINLLKIGECFHVQVVFTIQLHPLVIQVCCFKSHELIECLANNSN